MSDTNDAVGDELAPASTSGGGNGKKIEFRNGKKKARIGSEGYDSVLTAFDEYAAKGKGEAVGYGFEVGDMVWGKVKSHPWWPGHVYNEAFASVPVQKSKREGHLLVAFYGDSSYGWFDPAELIPFEENYEEKSKQTSSRPFLNAVEEAVEELSRRRNLGLACRCRNEFNFWPCSVEGYFVVDVGDIDPGFYSTSQINKARDEFRPKEMLSFIQGLAVTPMDDLKWNIGFMKNKATVLASRKAMFEEYDETYAQAFGSPPNRPARPTMPVAIDPSKATLGGRLVIAEALEKGKNSVKPKTKDQAEKDKYLFKRRDESSEMKSKKAAGSSTYPQLVDGSSFSGRLSNSGMGDHFQEISGSDVTNSVSNIKPSEGSSSNTKVGNKKAKLHKRHAGELSSEKPVLVQKKKKKKHIDITREPSGQFVKSPVAVENSVSIVNTSRMLFPAPHGDSKIQKDGVEGSASSPVEVQQKVAVRNLELSALVRDLRCLALNPFYGEERGCPAVTKQVFWKYRSLVYKKSLNLSQPPENLTAESHGSKQLAIAAAPFTEPAGQPVDKSKMKLVKPPVRADDPTKGGKKRPPLDRPEESKKKMKLGDSEDTKKKKKLIDSEDIKKKKKKIDSKLLAGEKKIPQRFIEPPRGDAKEIVPKNVGVKEIVPKNVGPTIMKAVKVESSKKMERSVRVPNPTMLIMKFQNNAGLPSGAELRAKFARFGPLDHSATRVFWKSYQCRLVYLYKADAEAALKFAAGCSNLFGNTNVRCHIREMETEAAEPEPARVQKEVSSVGALPSRDSAAEQRTASKPTTYPPQLQLSAAQQLKSCLKKPSGDESGNGAGRGGSRVKFILGGERSTTEIPSSGYKTTQITPFTESATSSTNSVDSSSKNLPFLNPQSSIATTTTTHVPSATRLEKFPLNVHSFEQVSNAFNAPPSAPQLPVPPPPPPPIDISQPMLSLLTRCSDVVNYVTGALGYAPYHSL